MTCGYVFVRLQLAPVFCRLVDNRGTSILLVTNHPLWRYGGLLEIWIDVNPVIQCVVCLVSLSMWLVVSILGSSISPHVCTLLYRVEWNHVGGDPCMVVSNACFTVAAHDPTPRSLLIDLFRCLESLDPEIVSTSS